jgi:hypothetical protein
MAGIRIAISALLHVATTAVAAAPLSSGQSDTPRDAARMNFDAAGLLQSLSTNRFSAGRTNGFFADLGTNGRTCGTCHVQENAWTITPSHVQSLKTDDPIFTPNDGSDCPSSGPSQGPDKSLSSQLTNYGLIRIQLAIAGTAGFRLASATNPHQCLIAPGSAGAGGQLFLFRRPLPSTNLIFDSAFMWDGRETLQALTTQGGFAGTGPMMFDLADQANSATTGHAQGAPIVGAPAQSDIVRFETNLYTAQLLALQPRLGMFAMLTGDGARGGADYLEDKVAPAFAIGVNDPLKPGFTNASFDLYAAWEPGAPNNANLLPGQRAIGRGEALFNNTSFVIHDVPGLNSSPDDPLFNPADPLAGQDIVGGCAVCHNSPNVGNHSSSLPINIGVTMAQPTNNDGSANTVLDLANLPVYTLQNSISGASVATTDPGKAMLSGKWTDIGKTKGPMLRGLAARAPYFHNGSAKDLTTVVDFYNQRFAIGLTPDQVDDLVAFLNAL